MHILHLKMCGFLTFYMKKLISLKALKSHPNTKYILFGQIHEITQNYIKFSVYTAFSQKFTNWLLH